MHTAQTSEASSIGVTHIWTRINPKWIISGLFAGLAAGVVIMLIGMKLSQSHLGESIQFFKWIGASFFGPDTTTLGADLGRAGRAGIVIHFTLSAIYGLVFAQLVHEKSKTLPLIILGLATSFVIWVFAGQLFMPSFNRDLSFLMPTYLKLFLHLGFGFSVGFFISIFRGILGVK